MAMSRLRAATPFTTFPPISTTPLLIDSSPAIMRNNVDLPQPDGPTKTTNSPSSISRSTDLTAVIAPPPNVLLNSLRPMDPIRSADVFRARDWPNDLRFLDSGFPTVNRLTLANQSVD